MVLAAAKRKSFLTYRSLEQLKAGLRSPCKEHAELQEVKPDSGIITLCELEGNVTRSNQVAFPRYLFRPAANPAAAIPLSLLAVNPNKQATVGMGEAFHRRS